MKKQLRGCEKLPLDPHTQPTEHDLRRGHS